MPNGCRTVGMRNKLLSGIVATVALTLPCGSQQARDEAFRPQVHFSQQEHWMNDPNGLVYFEGEYHLFFQYNPTAMTPGHIGWGHAVSRDLLHWQELPQALAETNGEMVFTGSAVVDKTNSSGLCEGGKPCLIAIYTGHRGSGAATRETQNIAASQDRGRTWTRFAGNPTLDLQMSNFRDPACHGTT
jgi:fructan beta-fructosidase